MFGKAKRAADVAQVILSTFALAILLVSWSLGTYAVGAGWLIAVLLSSWALPW